jgi:hypothetical protein
MVTGPSPLQTNLTAIVWQGERLAQDFGIRGYIIPFSENVKRVP